jgi:sulfide dehydrogenase cytochrome subunit
MKFDHKNRFRLLGGAMHKITLLTATASCLLFASSAMAEVNITGLANSCNNCHGTNGVSVGESMPSIGGLPEAYLKNVMMQWKSGERYSASMGRLIKGYSDEEIAALAAYFSKKPWVPVAQKSDKAFAKRASAKAVVEKCTACHGDTGAGDAETPHLNGQWAKYMELELMKWRDEAVAMPDKKMRSAAQKLNETDVKTAAEFFASQKK